MFYLSISCSAIQLSGAHTLSIYIHVSFLVNNTIIYSTKCSSAPQYLQNEFNPPPLAWNSATKRQCKDFWNKRAVVKFVKKLPVAINYCAINKHPFRWIPLHSGHASKLNIKKQGSTHSIIPFLTFIAIKSPLIFTHKHKMLDPFCYTVYTMSDIHCKTGVLAVSHHSVDPHAPSWINRLMSLDSHRLVTPLMFRPFNIFWESG